MKTATGVRIGWADLPAHIQRAVEEILGAPVVTAVSQPGGFSPGTADRVVTTTGGRAFVKAVSPALNDRSPAMHRAEAYVAAALPAGVPAPRLLGTYDDGDWIVLVLADVEGRHPVTPWDAAELGLVFGALARLASVATPCPVDGLPAAREKIGADLGRWRDVAAAPPEDLDPWAAAHLDALVALADRGAAALDGDTLVHLDVRADNLLIGPDRTVTLVDWPWASRGPAWLDRTELLANVCLHGGHDTLALLHRVAADTGADPDDLVGFIAGMAGFFTAMSPTAPPPGLPTLRAFQRAQADALIGWLRDVL